MPAPHNILVTGHKGYIGSVMAKALLRKGYNVFGIDTNYFKKQLSKPSNRFHETIKDIRMINPGDLNGIDAVIHLAAISSDSSSKINEDATMIINVSETERLARLAKDKGVKRFIFSSTCAMYGSSPDHILCTERTIPDPLSPYTRSKLYSEKDLSALADENFCPVFLRNSTVYGWSPRMRSDSPINSFIYTAINKNSIILKSNGLAWRPVLHIKDLTRAFILALEAPKEVVWNQVFNVGNTKDNFRLIDIAAEVRKLFPGLSIKMEDIDAHSSFKVDFTKIETELHFRSLWTLNKGYKEILDHATEIENLDRLYSNYRAMLYLLGQKEIDTKFNWISEELE